MFAPVFPLVAGVGLGVGSEVAVVSAFVLAVVEFLAPTMTVPVAPIVPLQTTTGDPSTVAVLVVAGRALAFGLACWIAYRAYRGSVRAREPALLWLAVGIALLAAAPTAVRFLLPTFTGASALTTALVARSSEVAGLCAILYAVYGNP